MTTITQLESRINSLEETVTKLKSVSESSDVYNMSKSERIKVAHSLKQSNARQFATRSQINETYAKCGVL